MRVFNIGNDIYAVDEARIGIFIGAHIPPTPSMQGRLIASNRLWAEVSKARGSGYWRELLAIFQRLRMLSHFEVRGPFRPWGPTTKKKQ